MKCKVEKREKEIEKVNSLKKSRFSLFLFLSWLTRNKERPDGKKVRKNRVTKRKREILIKYSNSKQEKEKEKVKEKRKENEQHKPKERQVKRL